LDASNGQLGFRKIERPLRAPLIGDHNRIHNSRFIQKVTTPRVKSLPILAPRADAALGAHPVGLYREAQGIIDYFLFKAAF
jgi:hypothetical protein